MVTRTHPPCYLIRTLPVLYMPNVCRLSSENTEWRKSYLIWAVVKHWVCGECCATLCVERMTWVLRHSVYWEDEVSVTPLCIERMKCVLRHSVLRGWSECYATLYWQEEVSVTPLCILRGWSECYATVLRGWSECYATLYWKDEVSVAPLCVLRGWSECCATVYGVDEVASTTCPSYRQLWKSGPLGSDVGSRQHA